MAHCGALELAVAAAEAEAVFWSNVHADLAQQLQECEDEHGGGMGGMMATTPTLTKKAAKALRKCVKKHQKK